MTKIKNDVVNYLIDYNLSENSITQYLDSKYDDIIEVDLKYFENNNESDLIDFIVMKTANIEVLMITMANCIIVLNENKKCRTDFLIQFAKNSLRVYAPIAHQLGLNTIKTDLEEICLYYIENELYLSIAKQLELKKSLRDEIIDTMISSLSKYLVDENIKFEIYGRSKSIYSIYKKMLDKDKLISDLFDLYAIRIICDNVINCYTVLGIVHSKFNTIETRFKDYIAIKKKNNYQSLHTAIYDDHNKVFEIQIRTKQMHDIAENGIAAHWMYKNKKKSTLGSDLSYLKSIVHKLDDVEATDDFFTNRIYVFTPNCKIIHLPINSTIIDFAYAIHSKIAEQMSGALVNGSIVKINYELKSDDVVEIITKKNLHSPNSDWLNIAITNRAKKKIKAYLKKRRDIDNFEAIYSGENKFKIILKKLGIDFDISIEKNKNKILRNYSFKRISDFFIAINNDKINENMIEEFFEDKNSKLKLTKIDQKRQTVSSIIVNGADDIKKSLAKCCNPIFGDEIVAVIVSGVGIKIHLKDCKNHAHCFNKLGASWNPKFIDQSFLYKVNIEIIAISKSNNLIDYINILNKTSITVEKVDSKVKQDILVTSLVLNVSSTEQLSKFFSNINKLKYILSIQRIMK